MGACWARAISRQRLGHGSRWLAPCWWATQRAVHLRPPGTTSVAQEPLPSPSMHFHRTCLLLSLASRARPAAALHTCPLCGREIPPALESRHHLTPKLKGGKSNDDNLVVLHRPCHDKVHAVFTEAELARSYSSVDALLSNEDIAKFARWIAKRPIDFSDGTTSLRRRRDRQWKRRR